MDYLKIALTAIANRDKLGAIIKDATAIFHDATSLWKRIQELFPELTKQQDVIAAPKTEMSVEWLQTSLNKLINAGLTVDGHYGDGTRNAVKQFQQANGLTSDGWAGILTQAAIVDALG